ncbi:hypothetical protein PYCC9005_000403 [Savitreella phatthalungensis]
MSSREVRDALPKSIPYYAFSGGPRGKVQYASGRPCPGKVFLDREDLLVRVTNANVSRNTGFTGQVISLGDDIDSMRVSDVVIGGKTDCLQQFIVVKRTDVIHRPDHVRMADGSLAYWGATLIQATHTLQPDMLVLVLGDPSGIAVQLAKAMDCKVHSDDTRDTLCEFHLDSENPLGWLNEHQFVYDCIIDAREATEVYDACAHFTSENAEYFSIEPSSSMSSVRRKFLPAAFGGGARKIVVVRHPSGKTRGQQLHNFLKFAEEKSIKLRRLEVVRFERVPDVYYVDRVATVIQVAKPVAIDDVVPDEPVAETDLAEEPETPKRDRSGVSVATTSGPSPNLLQFTPKSETLRTQSPANRGMYSPARPSTLAHSISASNLHDGEPEEAQSREDNRRASLRGGGINSSPRLSRSYSAASLQQLTSAAGAIEASPRVLAYQPGDRPLLGSSRRSSRSFTDDPFLVAAQDDHLSRHHTRRRTSSVTSPTTRPSSPSPSSSTFPHHSHDVDPMTNPLGIVVPHDDTGETEERGLLEDGGSDSDGELETGDGGRRMSARFDRASQMVPRHPPKVIDPPEAPSATTTTITTPQDLDQAKAQIAELQAQLAALQKP